jgi:general secretion pathway protein H
MIAAATSRALFRRARARGLTLIEMLVVLAIVGLLAVGVLMGSGQLASSKLKKTATSLSGVIRLAYTRASSTSKSVRLVFDFSQHAFWMEEAEQAMLVTPKDSTGTGGAEAVTALEQQSIAESDRLIKGPSAPRAHFRQVDMGLLAIDSDTHGSVRALPGNISFRAIQTTHDDQPRTQDRAYLYFWPGGQTERASIQLRIGESTEDADTLTLLVAPLTGSVNVKSGPVPLTVPKDEAEASDREDKGL